MDQDVVVVIDTEDQEFPLPADWLPDLPLVEPDQIPNPQLKPPNQLLELPTEEPDQPNLPPNQPNQPNQPQNPPDQPNLPN